MRCRGLRLQLNRGDAPRSKLRLSEGKLGWLDLRSTLVHVASFDVKFQYHFAFKALLHITLKMDIDDDDDFYAPEESAPPTSEKKEQTPQQTQVQTGIKSEQQDEDLEEGEEEDEEVEEDEDSDIDIITERKDGTKAAPPS